MLLLYLLTKYVTKLLIQTKSLHSEENWYSFVYFTENRSRTYCIVIV